ncbi:MAG: hypothetical protein U0790_10960 [Isosphaeraceae bacterium]
MRPEVTTSTPNTSSWATDPATAAYSECWNLRLFRHKLGRYERMPDHTGGRAGDNEAHEHVELDGRVLRLTNELDHYAYPTIATWVEKHNRYAVWEATMYERFRNEPVPAGIGKGKRLKRWLKKVYLRLPLRPLVRFAYSYVVRLGFLDGKPGLVFCTLLSFYDFLAWANVYEQSLRGRLRPDEMSPRIAGGGRVGGGRGLLALSSKCAADHSGRPPASPLSNGWKRRTLPLEKGESEGVGAPRPSPRAGVSPGLFSQAWAGFCAWGTWKSPPRGMALY